MMVGITSLIPLVFLRISTLGLPRVIFKSTSSTILLVLPSITTNLGSIEYPLPKEVIPTESNVARVSTLIVCGRRIFGFNVWSDGRSNPMLFNLNDFSPPTFDPDASKIAPVPARESTLLTEGSE